MRTIAPFPSADIFIETGFGLGRTLLDLIQQGTVYDEIHTIEFEPGAVGRARMMARTFPQIRVHQGSSPDVLPGVMDPSKRTVFWLDAHFAPAESVGDPQFLEGIGQCPLLQELAAIRAVSWRVPPEIFIDDVLLFQRRDYTGTYAAALDPTQFPTEDEVRSALPEGYVLDIGLETGEPRYYHAHVV